VPKIAGAVYTFGWFAAFDPNPDTGTLLIWGNNQIELMGGFIKEGIRSALLSKAKLIVIDPKRVDIAKRADLWIPPRPNTDGILAMGISKYLIENNLYDKEFVDNWTVGFEEIKKEVSTFTFEDVERISWVSKETIKNAAEILVKHRPVCLVPGNGIEKGIHAFQQLRSIYIVRTLLGAINTSGGNVDLTPGNFTRPGIFYQLKDSLRQEKINENRMIGTEHEIAKRTAYIPTQSLIKTILTEDPYPIKAAICILTNPLVSFPDSKLTHEAFCMLDLLVVCEIFPSPTSEIADIVLPVAWGCEHDSLGYWPGWHQEMRAYPKVVEPPGEAKAESYWINELAKRLGFRDRFWEHDEDSYDEMLKPSGMKWEEFVTVRSLDHKKEYKKPEEGAFKTKTKKVEIYSNTLEKIGIKPMPTFAGLSTFRFHTSEKYPLVLFNGKEAAYMMSSYHCVKFLREKRKEPTVDLHPNTAKKYGLKEGEWIYIETHKGRIKQKLRLDRDLDERLVYASFGWYFPEKNSYLFGYEESNINILTDAEPPYDVETGSAELANIPCRVYKEME
jgi:anaerobic selenocysteine-containing dehydrogenase